MAKPLLSWNSVLSKSSFDSLRDHLLTRDFPKWTSNKVMPLMEIVIFHCSFASLRICSQKFTYVCHKRKVPRAALVESSAIRGFASQGGKPVFST